MSDPNAQGRRLCDLDQDTPRGTEELLEVDPVLWKVHRILLTIPGATHVHLGDANIRLIWVDSICKDQQDIHSDLLCLFPTVAGLAVVQIIPHKDFVRGYCSWIAHIDAFMQSTDTRNGTRSASAVWFILCRCS